MQPNGLLAAAQGIVIQVEWFYQKPPAMTLTKSVWFGKLINVLIRYFANGKIRVRYDIREILERFQKDDLWIELYLPVDRSRQWLLDV